MPYTGEIRLFAGTFAPSGWLVCDGQLLPISENEGLFLMCGTMYGGDGESTFGVPDLRARVPIHRSSQHIQGEMAGVDSVTISTNQMPRHSHTPIGSNATAASTSPAGNVFATLSDAGVQSAYGEDEPFLALSQTAVTPQGGSQPHDNRQPFGVMNYIISLYGPFPSQT